jgi:hypothetical protein
MDQAAALHAPKDIGACAHWSGPVKFAVQVQASSGRINQQRLPGV